MRNIKENNTKIHKLTDLAKKIDRQLMDLLKNELQNFRQMNKGESPSTSIA